MFSRFKGKDDWRATTSVADAAVYPLDRSSSPRSVKGGLRAPGLPGRFEQRRKERTALPGLSPASATDHAWLADQPKPAKSLKGHYLYGGPFFRHFGHFLAESPHRLWAWHENGAHYDGVIVCPQTLEDGDHARTVDALPGFIGAACTYLGIPPEKIITVRTPLLVEKLTVPVQASIFGGTTPLAGDYLDFLAARADMACGPIPAAGLPKKIYVSRSDFLHKGSYAGERYMESLLAADDFFIFKPERYPLLDQLRHYRAAHEIVFAEGSAVHALELLGQLDAKMLLLQRRRHSLNTMTSVLRPRARGFAHFDQGTALPSIMEKRRGGAASGNAMTLVDAQALVEFLRSETSAALKGFDQDEFFKQEAADVARHLLNVTIKTDIAHASLPQRFAEFRAAIKGRPNPWLKEKI